MLKFSVNDISKLLLEEEGIPSHIGVSSTQFESSPNMTLVRISCTMDGSRSAKFTYPLEDWLSVIGKMASTLNLQESDENLSIVERGNYY